MGGGQSSPVVIISDIVSFSSTKLRTSINGESRFFTFDTSDFRESFFFFFFILMSGSFLSGKTDLSVRVSFFILFSLGISNNFVFDFLFNGFISVKKRFSREGTFSESFRFDMDLDSLSCGFESQGVFESSSNSAVRMSFEGNGRRYSYGQK